MNEKQVISKVCERANSILGLISLVIGIGCGVYWLIWVKDRPLDFYNSFISTGSFLPAISISAIMFGVFLIIADYSMRKR
jgi:hypothetical protein